MHDFLMAGRRLGWFESNFQVLDSHAIGHLDNFLMVLDLVVQPIGVLLMRQNI